MQIVVEQAGERREVDLVVDAPDACVADLLAAAGVERGGVTIGGRFFGPSLGLDEIGLHEGAVVRLGEAGPPEPDRSTAGPVLAVTDGPAAGRILALRDEQLLGRGDDCDVVLADPAVSHAHATVAPRGDGSALVVDLGSHNGTWIDGVAVTEPAVLAPGAVLRLGATRARLWPRLPADRSLAVDPLRRASGGLVPFNRPPRPALPAPGAALRPPATPAGTARTRGLSVTAVVAPLVVGGVLVWLYRDPRFALFLLLSPVLAIGNWLGGRRRDRRDGRAADRAFQGALATFEAALDDAAAAEVRRRELLLVDLAETVRRATAPSTALWQRRPPHADFLRLRAGVADVAWIPPLEESREPAAPEVLAALDRHRVLRDCPVEVDLSDGGVVGLVGDRAAALALARSLVVQAAVHHGPADLGVVVCTSPGHRDDWDWAKWLPHTRGAPGRTLAGEPAAAEELLRRLLRERDRAAGQVLMLVLDDPTLVEGRRAPARLLLGGAGGPVCGIVLAASSDQLPAVASTVVTLHSDLGDAQLRQPQAGAVIDGVVVGGLPEPAAREAARTLARYEDPELAVAGAGIPQLVRLLPLLGMDPPDPAAVLRHWAGNGPDPPPSTPLGVGEDGVVTVDLARDGPHGLVGGTTGSGKSELLRSLVAGLAARVDPAHLVFVLVDYKGGSAFRECARLPHTVGMVTDLDEHLGERALRSLEAELGARERTLRDAGMADLPGYLRAGAPLGPLPRLVVVIDEFATLAAELPDFLGALVGIAQRGRSLGVHLVLATQRPSGAVNANVRANTNLRIALRVQDAQDSADIIDLPDAAALSRSLPGRAYLRRGHGDVTPVQTALAGGAAGPGGSPGVRLPLFTFGTACAEPGARAPAEGSEPTDLVRLVDAVAAAFAQTGQLPPRRPWLPMLGERIDLAELLAPGSAGEVTFALADDPDAQRQVPCGWDPDEGHLAVFGMVGSGTTTALLAVATALVQRHRPDDCHLYGIDYGGGGLAPLGAFPHTGAVVPAEAGEAQLRLLRHLRRELDRRRALPPARRAGEPRIVVLVDGIGGFLADHEDLDSADALDTFRRVFSEGAGVGILFVVAGERPGMLPVRLAALVGQRLLLRLADPTEFAVAGLRPRQLPAFVPGRGIATPSRLVVQVGHPGDDLAGVAERVRARWGPPTRPPAPVRTLPATLPLAALPLAALPFAALPPGEPGGAAARGPGALRLLVGVRDDDLGPAVLTLDAADHALVAGPPRSGKTSVLALLAALVRRADPRAVLVGVCDNRSPLFAHGALDAAGTLADLEAVLRLAERNADRLWLVLVDDAPLVEDRAGVMAAALRSRRPRFHVVGAGRTDDLRAAYGHWSRGLRQSRNGLLLQPNLTTDGDLLGVRLPRRVPIPMPPGRGFLVSGADAALVQVALPPPATVPGHSG